MRDLNSLYSEFLVMNTIRERQHQARMHARIVEARAERPLLAQRLARAIRALRPARPVTIGGPAALAEADQGTAA